MDIVLIAGLWLTVSVWDPVVQRLAQAGHRPLAVRLPGQDEPGPASLEDQLAAVLTAVDATEHAVVVGHSAACTLAWLAADRRPDRVARSVLIGGFPVADGQPYADFFAPVDGVMAFPGWAEFEGPDSADLDETARERFLAAAVPVPEQVSRGTVRYADPRRFDVPATMVCPEFGPDDARDWIAAGSLPELAAARQVDFVDLDSGHWPMITQPDTLAGVLADCAGR